MELYHATDGPGAAGIYERGFAGSVVPDSPKASWLSSNRESAEMIAGRRGWIVVVDIPSEIAEQHRRRFNDGEPYLDTYLVPWAVLNGHQPFNFEHAAP